MKLLITTVLHYPTNTFELESYVIYDEVPTDRARRLAPGLYVENQISLSRYWIDTAVYGNNQKLKKIDDHVATVLALRRQEIIDNIL